MTHYEKLLSARVLVGILVICVLTLGILLYNSYATDLYAEVEHTLAVSMGTFNSGIAAR